MEAVIDGVSLYVERRGEGQPTLVFLHYWGGTGRTWSKIAAQLQSQFEVVTYDMRGWGHSAPSPDGYSMHALATEALRLIEHIQLKRFVLIGHSMGAKVAQLLASGRPKGLVALVLVAPATPTPNHLPKEAKEQQLHAYDNRETVLQTLAFLSSRTADTAESVEQIIEDSLSGQPDAKLAWPTAGMLEDISSEVGKIEVPTLVLAGERDRLDSIEQHKQEVVARIPGAVLEIIPYSGHLLPIDEPRRTADAIRAFLQERLGGNDAG